jgi:hypothetical protein
MTVGFSKTFSLNMETLSRALRAFAEQPKMSKADQMRYMGIGSIATEGYTNWLRVMGLRDSLRRTLTPLGECLVNNDPYLGDIVTKWVLHYHLCREGGKEGAEVWFHLFHRFLPNYTEFRYAQFVRYLQEESGIQTANRKGPAVDAPRALHCYTEEMALGELAILHQDNKCANVYRKGNPQHVPPLVVAYVIYSERERHYPTVTTIRIDNLLSDDGSAGKVFLLTRTSIEEILHRLEFEGIVSVSHTADLDSVGFTYQGSALDLLETYYERQ